MAATLIFVFDSSPLVASCPFAAGESWRRSSCRGPTCRFHQQFPRKWVTRGGTRADALKAAELIAAGHIRVEDTTAVGEVLEDLQHCRLGQGETEALTLTAGLGNNTLMVTDDFLVLIVAKRLGLSC